VKPLAEALGSGIAALEHDHLPDAAIKTAKTGIIDCIAVMVAGSGEPPVQLLRKTLAASGGAAEASLCFSSERAPAADAAWINGTAGHVLDYDDFARGHPSVVIVPAILAEAEVLDASGADLVTA
jgi:2-methylcitrate dehydratase PrpD